VVELADTPSPAALLLGICNLLIEMLVTLNPITYSASPKLPPVSAS
jgi:hypothetical protein